MGKKFFAIFLSFAMIMSVFTGMPVVYAEDEDIGAWYSAEKDGGAVQYVEKGSEAYVNYEYKGNEADYNVQVEVSTAGDIILSRQYMNVSRNSIPVLFEEEGRYTLSVHVMDGENITASAVKTLECVTGLPVIDKQPEDIAADIGKAVTFTVSSRTEGVSYQWHTANALMGEGRAISGASADHLTISAENVTDSLNGTYYYCQVTANGYTINSSYALLTINGAAATQQPEPSTEPTEEPGGKEEPTETPGITDIPSETPDITQQPDTPGTPDIPANDKETPKPTNPPKPTNNPAGTDSPKETDSPVKTAAPGKIKCKAKAAYSISGNKIKVSWNDCAAFYKVYRSTKKKSGYMLKKTVKGTSYTDAKVSHGKTYYYKIQPVKAGTKVNISGIVSVKVNVKPAAKKYSVKKKGKNIKVAWKYNRADYVEVCVNTGNGWSRLGRVPGKKSYCSIGVPGGYSMVKVRIRAYNIVKKKKYYSKYSKAKTIRI
ncbi:MAG: hypothetical protein NC489_43395 [Ruminococcus flavefaciens]|nr:hypothetical protein [Ruminococcus flavefaciens]